MDWPGNYSWVSSGWRLTRLATGRVRPVSGPTVLRTVLRLTAATPQSVAGSVCLNQALLTLYIVTAGAFYAIVSTVPQCWHPRVPSVEIMGWRLLFRSIRNRFPGISKPFQEKIWNRQHVADLRRSLIPLFFSSLVRSGHGYWKGWTGPSLTSFGLTKLPILSLVSIVLCPQSFINKNEGDIAEYRNSSEGLKLQVLMPQLVD